MNGLRARRLAAGLSQKELGLMLGVSAQAVAKWENGTAWPSAFYLPDIAEALGCNIADLYRDDTSSAPDGAPSPQGEGKSEGEPADYEDNDTREDTK